MAVEVILPKVDMDMATGKIARWHVKDGDSVKKGAALFEIETDKAAMEVDSPGDGVIRNITALAGDVIPVGAVVAHIYAEGEAVAAPMPKSAAEAPTFKAGQQAPVITAAKSGSVRATPLARRLAREAALPLDAITGSGPQGRIVMEDVRRAAAAKQSAPATAAITAPSDDWIQRLYEPGSFDIQPVDAMRRTIAQRLTLSKQTIPHFYLSVTCDLTRLGEARAALNANAPLQADRTPAWKLSINDFVIKALALALQRVPAANVTWTDGGILRHRTSDVGVAVAVEGGLFTPVVRAAEAKPLSAISREMKELAARARARKLTPLEYQGGTTAVSNLGMFGIEQFTAIVNPPHASILAVGASIESFVPMNGLPVLRTRMTCTLSCDHRAVDGAVGAELLSAFRSFIEDPMLMLA